MTKSNFDIAIIGGGASGLCAGIQAKRNNPQLRVAIFEHLNRVGKKILATGNGRCNLTNLNAEKHCYRNKAFCDKIFEKFGVSYTLDFFKSLGLFTVSDSEGRVYPRSNTAASVLDCLRFGAEAHGVEIICDEHIDTIEKTGQNFLINKKFYSEKIILATGSKASPSQGSDGSGYKILKDLGIKTTRLFPSLVSIKTENTLTRQLKGIRSQVKLSLVDNNKEIFSSNGEILFADYGVSGIVSMEASAEICDRKNLNLVVDFLPEFHPEEIKEIIISTRASNLENCLSGLLPKKLSQVICKTVDIDCGFKKSSDLDKNTLEKIINSLKKFTLKVTGTRGYENAQVTRGGAEVSQFSETLESKKIKNLYCIGELLDVDGRCGGFNLQWAWSSGLTAGYFASKGK